MQTLFVILVFLSLVGLSIGLISPELVIRWGSKRTRGRVVLTYGLAIVIFFILIGVTASPNEQEKEKLVVTPSSTKQESHKSRVTPSPLVKQETKRFGLSDWERRKIWKELILAEDRAEKEADRQYPPLDDPTQSLRIGQIFELTEETPLMPELEPKDPLVALQKIRYLPSETTIKVLRVVKRHQIPWYFVEATSPSKVSLCSGWINSIALMGQSQVDSEQQLDKIVELMNHLIDKYKGELAEKYGLTLEQLDEIADEGIEKDWPFPK